ncbi:AGBL4 [Lepeophtheirus salmonis]|uniref:AGBL4 n=1 Tax=Lepeophtheirus salmonis TaxID=72036 RepID=A0A7R8CQY9_LEPSM|nr:AGBL4 [Lepeophtheirus salmonis]CAF2899818.1 AGBL4 [Lepeophtheirus salmonis]
MCDSDSDDEGVLTNVNKLVIRPPGHTGKAKKGHVCFDSGFETMNLGRVDFISDQEYDLYIRPDTGNPRHRLWFYFTIDNTQANQKVIFNFINLSKYYLLFREGLTPVVKSCSRPIWQRIPKPDVFYYKSSIHSGRYVLSFVFCFDLEDEKYHLALAEPYSFSRHNDNKETESENDDNPRIAKNLWSSKMEKYPYRFCEGPSNMLENDTNVKEIKA